MYDSSDAVFYCDPPYYKKEYLYEGCKDYGKDFHIELHNELKKLKGKVVLSYEENRFITDLYKDFNIHCYDGDTKIFDKELIITNF
jgi:DNA adenine methylase